MLSTWEDANSIRGEPDKDLRQQRVSKELEQEQSLKSSSCAAAQRDLASCKVKHGKVVW